MPRRSSVTLSLVALYIYIAAAREERWTESAGSDTNSEARNARWVAKWRGDGEPHGGRQTTLILLTLVQDSRSWGKGRSHTDHLQLVARLLKTANITALGFLISDSQEQQQVACSLSSLFREAPQVRNAADHGSILSCPDKPPVLGGRLQMLARATVVQPGMLGGADWSVPAERNGRHSFPQQRERRGLLARLRNLLLSTALQDEQYVLWVDADVYSIPDTMLPQMLASGLDIITPSCKWRRWYDRKLRYYDYNTWAGPLQLPSESDRTEMKTGIKFQPKIWWDRLEGVGSRPKFLPDFEISKESFVQVTAVGATVLLVRADVHRQGAIFTPGYSVGAEWNASGWDGIESEGLCLLAGQMGFTCWGMPHIAVLHEPPPQA